MPTNNTWSLIGAAVAAIAVIVLQALLNFFNSGIAWPVTTVGWLHVLLPAAAAGVLAVLTPHYSVSEAKTGQRMINSAKRDAPVLDRAEQRVFDTLPYVPSPPPTRIDPPADPPV